MSVSKSRVIYLILAIFIMIIIFLFSSQASNDSNYLSYSITNFIFERTESKEVSAEVNTNKNVEKKFPTSDKTFHDINTVVRKSAHVFLYMMLGIFIILYIKTYNISTKKAILITISICFIYACLDEFNQYLRGTRTALFTDSLIDTCGCMLGCLIIEIRKRIIFVKIKKD